MKYNRTILHPSEEDFNRHVYNKFSDKFRNESEFYYEECKIGDLYDKWINIFKSNGIVLFGDPVILKFSNYKYSYTPFTYKLNFNFGPTITSGNDDTMYYTLTDDDHKIFAKLFLIDGWEEELIYTFSDHDKKIRNSNYSSNGGEIDYHTKPWVDYLTFDGSRIILQFRFDDYLKSADLRKEKLKKLNSESIKK